MILELERAQRVGNAFDRVGQTVSEIVERIDAPLVVGIVMGGMQDAVKHRIAQVDVRRAHVDFGAQYVLAVGVAIVLHILEQLQVFLDAALTMRTVGAGFGQGAAIGADLLGALAVDIGLALLDQIDCPRLRADRNNRRRMDCRAS